MSSDNNRTFGILESEDPPVKCAATDCAASSGTGESAPGKAVANMHPKVRVAVAKLGLTQRESQIVEKFAVGKSTQTLAEELCISVATVRTHLRKIFAKLEIGSRVELLSLVLSRVLEDTDSERS